MGLEREALVDALGRPGRPDGPGRLRRQGSVTFRASVLMNSLRGATFSPMSIVKISSAAAAFSLSTRSSVRVSGFIVVSQSWSAFISPRPLKRWTERFFCVDLLDDPVAFLLALGVAGDLAGADAVERRLGDVQVARVDDLGHVPIEERQQQRPDVGAVHVGVGHDDDPVVPQLRDVEAVADALDPGAERDDQRPDVLAGHDLVEAGLLDVQELAAQRQDRLEPPVAALLGRAAGRVALDDVELAARRIALLAVGELARQRQAVERALADHEVARLAGGLARARRAVRHFSMIRRPSPGFSSRYWPTGVRDRGLDLALDLGVAELGLRLALELRLGELDADDRRQAFADVVAGEVARRRP